jgi:Zn-dependent protease
MSHAGAWFLFVPVLVFSVVVHECAHGVMALWRGDPTARDLGRLTLNPIPHLHWLGSVVLPLLLLLAGSRVLFGWAKPVPINWANLRTPRNDQVRVALAGPASNLMLALGFAGMLAAAPERGVMAGLRFMGAYGVLLNCGLAVVNMIPVPPLDGSWLVVRFLPLRHLYVLQRFRLFGLAALLVLLLIPSVSFYLVQVPVLSLAGACLRVFGLSAERLLEVLT